MVVHFKTAFLVLPAFLLSDFVLKSCIGYELPNRSQNNPYHHKATLDPKYELEWIVNWEESKVLFNVTVQTKGYVGFGLSNKGKMSGADIVIGGVLPNGKPYFSDRHGVGNHQIPEIDESQDYILHEARENSTHTFLSFSRPFDTCDNDHDLPIDYDYIAVIWAFGEKDDDLENHFHNRGVYDAYLLDATLTPNLDELNSSKKSKSSRDLSLWTISMEQEIPAQDTAYICTMHKAPSHRTKQHIVGFRSVLPTELEVRHIHHFLLHRCVAPEDKDPVALFDQFVRQPGQECYVLTNPNPFPTQYCRQVAHEWAVGAYPIFFPDHVGIPLSESPNEYYLLQMHYDNPEVLSGLQLRFSLEVYYTSILRQHDLGLMYVGKATPGSPSIMIPPSELNHTVYGQCGSGCTNLMLSKSGIHVVAAKLHTHLAGRGMRLIHIRNNEELPWLSYDDNYNFNFQPIRLLREERTILPGDQLVIRCTYETTDRNGSVTVGGFSTRNEMCNGFIWFYNKLNGFAGVCSSEIRSETYKKFLQISNTTWSDARRENVVTAPRQNAGLLVSQAGNRINWTIERRDQLQYYHRYLPQVSGCPRLLPDEQSELQLPIRGRFSTRKRTLRRNALLDTSFKNEQTEFVTMYPENIVPYSRPQLCTK